MEHVRAPKGHSVFEKLSQSLISWIVATVSQWVRSSGPSKYRALGFKKSEI